MLGVLVGKLGRRYGGCVVGIGKALGGCVRRGWKGDEAGVLVGWAWVDVRGGWEEDVIGVSWKYERVGTGLDGCISLGLC